MLAGPGDPDLTAFVPAKRSASAKFWERLVLKKGNGEFDAQFKSGTGPSGDESWQKQQDKTRLREESKPAASESLSFAASWRPRIKNIDRKYT
jgi:hypothetical protein